MKILISPQAYKGTLSAIEVAKAIELGVHRIDPDAETVLLPVSDGGDGFLDVMLTARKGERRHFYVLGALGEKIEASWGVIPNPKTAVIELAKVCGLAQIPKDKRNPALTTTYGVGEVIRQALDEGIRHFLIGIGGSATNDAGVGIAQALGARFIDDEGKELELGGAALRSLAEIDLSGLDSRIKESKVVVGYDVVNPFTGSSGASIVYSPQKGATPQITTELEKSLSHLSKIISKKWNVDLNSIPGTGAAGGAGGGLYTFLGAELKLGIDLVLDYISFEDALEGVDLVITGEGCIDSQTLFHKAPMGVAKRAKQKNISVTAVVGSLGDGYQAVYEHGIDRVTTLNAFKTLNW